MVVVVTVVGLRTPRSWALRFLSTTPTTPRLPAGTICGRHQRRRRILMLRERLIVAQFHWLTRLVVVVVL